MKIRNIPTPFEPGKYWYTTLELPEGVTASLVKTELSDAVRLVFTSKDVAMNLVTNLNTVVRGLEEGRSVAPDTEPEEVGPTGGRKGAS